MRTAVILCVALFIAGCTGLPPQPLQQSTSIRATDDLSLRRIDDRQRTAVQSGDAAAMEALTHRDYRVNAPSNRVLTREQVIGMIKSGAIAADRFERTIEAISVAGDVGIVMGRETVEVPGDSESGRLFGTGTLHRRFTNIYLRNGSGWLFIARHANVAPQVTPN